MIIRKWLFEIGLGILMEEEMKYSRLSLKIKGLLLILGIACIGFNKGGYAAGPQQETINFSSGLGAPITTAVADTAAKGGFGVSERIEYYPANAFSDEQLLKDEDIESLDYDLTNYLALSYGVLKNLTMGISIPYVNISNIRGAFPNKQTQDLEVVKEGSSTGLGDANLYGLWKLKEFEKSKVAFATLMGLNMPTGRTHAKGVKGVFSAGDQPGSGAWSPLIGLIVSQSKDKFLWAVNAVYTRTTRGTQQTTLGSTYTYNIAGVYQLYKSKNNDLDGILELNGEYANKDNIKGVLDNNSGGHSLFLTPGFRGNLGGSISLYLGITLPVIQNLNGSQVHYKYGIISGIEITKD